MAETPPPIPDYTSTDPAALAERVAYDSYFDSSEQPIGYRTAIEQMAEHAVENPAYHQAVHQAERLSDPSDGELLDDALLVSVLRQSDQLVRHRATYVAERRDLFSGRTSPDRRVIVQEALDQPMPELPEPYAQPQRLAPSERNRFYDPKFEALLGKVAEMAEYQMDRSSPQWRQSRDRAAFALRKALLDNPEQVYRVEALQAALERNAARSKSASSKTTDAHTDAQKNLDDTRARYSSGDPGDIRKPFGTPDKFRQPPAGGTDEQLDRYRDHERKRLLGRMSRLLPGASRRRANAAAYVSKSVSAVRNPHIALAEAELAESVAETGRFGAKSEQINANFDQYKLDGYREILSQIEQFNESSDPDQLEAMFGALTTPEQVAAFNQEIDQRVANWHHDKADLAAEFEVFQSFVQTRDYLYALRSALDTMSPHNSRYQRLHQMHAELSTTHHTLAFRMMLQRRELATLQGHHEGRLEVSYTPDMGLMQGNDDIIRYPDGSTLDLSAGRSAKRLNADGSAWTGPGDEHVITVPRQMAKRLENRDMATVLRGFDQVRDSWYVTPSTGNRNEAFSVSRLVNRRAEADAQRHRNEFMARRQQAMDNKDPNPPKVSDYVEDPENRRRINESLYAILYFGSTPGEQPDPGDPYITAEGYIDIPYAEFYGQPGQWLVGKDGSMSLLLRGKVVQHYKADGTPV